MKWLDDWMIPIPPKSLSMPKLHPDTRTLDQLYEVAKQEIGNDSLIIYAGGDVAWQQNDTRNAFEARFSGIRLEIIVDFSKFHDARLDYQLERKKFGFLSVIPDVIQLQTLQDFPRWKSEGVLMNYKPIGWSHVNAAFKDPDGAFTAVFMLVFTNNLNTTNLDAAGIQWPTEALDYLKPEFKHRLVMTYPNDDDAVLFLFKQIVDIYGFEYLEALVAQNVTWVRGSQAPLDLVGEGQFLATMTSANGLQPVPGQPRLVLPQKSPFVIWPQTAAILEDTPYPETAKLYISWLLSLQRQNADSDFSVRDDVQPPSGYKSIWQYPNGDPTAFGKFMADRAGVERFKNQVSVIVGEPLGPNPNGNLGTLPQKAVFGLT